MENSTLTLDEVHRYFVQEYIPIICVLSLAGVIGTIGNILTIIFYTNSRACSTNTLIITLAWMDLFVCVTSFGLVVQMYLNVLITNRIFCLTLHVVLCWAAYASIMTLWVISIDRYSKLCRPMKRQMSVKNAKLVAAIVLCITAMLSSRKGFTNKVVKISLKIPGQKVSDTVSGYSCTDSPDHNLGTIVWAFHIIEAVCFIGVCLTLVITYSRIMRGLINHHRELRHVSTKSSDNEQTREKKTEAENKRKRSDNNDANDCNSISETESECPTDSIHVSDIAVTIPESKHTIDNESAASNILTVIEQKNGGQAKQIPSSSQGTNDSMTGSVDAVDYSVAEKNAVENKPIQKNITKVVQDTDADRIIETSTEAMNRSVEKLNGVRNSQIPGHEPEPVDEEIRDPQVSSSNTLHRSVLNTNYKQTKRRKTHVNNIKRSERRVSFMMLAASVGFLCCFLPYMVMRLTQPKWQHFNENDFSVEMWIPFLLPIINSVINPILYSVLNQRYRMFVKGCAKTLLLFSICKPRD